MEMNRKHGQGAWLELKNRLVTLPTQTNIPVFQQIETATRWTLMPMRKGDRT